MSPPAGIQAEAGKAAATLTGGSNPSGKNVATAYGPGGGRQIIIPSGQLFSGRTAGNGTRDEVFGTQTYGSGYPGVNGRGVDGRGFPFHFWPLVWADLGYGPPSLHTTEYGEPNNSSRPGRSMYEATFVSNSMGTTFHILADNSTVISLVSSINATCSFATSNSSSATHNLPVPYNTSSSTSAKPEQTIQYYRTSSVVLTLDGYNDTAALSDDANADNTPLPNGIDSRLLDCLNSTIAAGAPLIDSALSSAPTGPAATATLIVGMIWMLRWIVGAAV